MTCGATHYAVQRERLNGVCIKAQAANNPRKSYTQRWHCGVDKRSKWAGQQLRKFDVVMVA
jgi:hypothetical protein